MNSNNNITTKKPLLPKDGLQLQNVFQLRIYKYMLLYSELEKNTVKKNMYLLIFIIKMKLKVTSLTGFV